MNTPNPLHSPKRSRLAVSKLNGDIGGIKIGDDFPVRVMGVMNLHSSSFYKGSVRDTKELVLETAHQMEAEGADLIDIGARSTAPYRKLEVSIRREEELLKWAIRILVDQIGVPISVDTARAKPAETALAEGATVLNDPYGLNHMEGQLLAKLARKFECSLIITAHEKKNMKIQNPVRRVVSALIPSLKLARGIGVDKSKIIVDPGIGFFSDRRISNVAWNSNIVSNLEMLREVGHPIMVGVSRKRFLGILGGGLAPEERLPGSLSAAAIAVYNGAHVIRTHDVKETREAILVASSMRNCRQKSLSR